MCSLRVCKIHRSDQLVVFGIESVTMHSGMADTFCHFHGAVEAVAVVVCTPAGVHGLGVDGRSVDIEPLRDTVPGLNTLLDSCTHPDR